MDRQTSLNTMFTDEQIAVLTHLSRNGRCSALTISQGTGFDEQTVVDRLVELGRLGLVRRSLGSGFLWQITNNGQNILKDRRL
jgi:DNA-binding IclR family transcriptional regulator